MSDSVSRVLDEIDHLVDDSLSRGDLSGSFHGERYDKCWRCHETWHFLPITENMRAMRNGSYARDEFGQGIVDPDYSYRDDTSEVLCPGSTVEGPSMSGGWRKQSRERGPNQPRIDYDLPTPRLPSGVVRTYRFIGPFEPWVIALDDERVIEQEPRGTPRVMSISLTATFTLADDGYIRNVDYDFVHEHQNDILDTEINPEGLHARMAPVVIPFNEIRVYGSDPAQEYLDYVEFRTSYPIERHGWMAQYWLVEDSSSVQGLEPDFVTIDEAYQFNTEELRQHVEEAQATSRRLAEETQTPHEAHRGSAVLRRSP